MHFILQSILQKHSLREISRAKEWAKNHPKVVIKPWDGNGGRGVLVTAHDDPNFRSMLEILTENEEQYILVQEYLPEIVEGDKRIILIGGKPVGQMLRIPQKGDHRGNMHVGARVESCELTKIEQEICAKLGLNFGDTIYSLLELIPSVIK